MFSAKPVTSPQIVACNLFTPRASSINCKIYTYANNLRDYTHKSVSNMFICLPFLFQINIYKCQNFTIYIWNCINKLHRYESIFILLIDLTTVPFLLETWLNNYVNPVLYVNNTN